MGKQTNPRKNAIKAYLELIVDAANKIGGVMAEMPHPDNLARQSLSYAKESVLHGSDGSIQAAYLSRDGTIYKINITRDSKQKQLSFQLEDSASK